jgi:hypothetical protein
MSKTLRTDEEYSEKIELVSEFSDLTRKILKTEADLRKLESARQDLLKKNPFLGNIEGILRKRKKEPIEEGMEVDQPSEAEQKKATEEVIQKIRKKKLKKTSEETPQKDRIPKKPKSPRELLAGQIHEFSLKKIPEVPSSGQSFVDYHKN